MILVNFIKQKIKERIDTEMMDGTYFPLEMKIQRKKELYKKYGIEWKDSDAKFCYSPKEK